MFTIKPNAKALTEKFACYFTEKIGKVREELDIMETVIPSVKEMNTRRDDNGLDTFEPVTEAEVNKILKNLSNVFVRCCAYMVKYRMCGFFNTCNNIYCKL